MSASSNWSPFSAWWGSVKLMNLIWRGYFSSNSQLSHSQPVFLPLSSRCALSTSSPPSLSSPGTSRVGYRLNHGHKAWRLSMIWSRRKLMKISRKSRTLWHRDSFSMPPTKSTWKPNNSKKWLSNNLKALWTKCKDRAITRIQKLTMKVKKI